MDAPSVVPETQPDKPRVGFISRQEHRRRLGGISKPTEWRLLRDDPEHPRPVPMPPGNQTKCYVDAESARYCERVLERARNGGG